MSSRGVSKRNDSNDLFLALAESLKIGTITTPLADMGVAKACEHGMNIPANQSAENAMENFARDLGQGMSCEWNYIVSQAACLIHGTEKAGLFDGAATETPGTYQSEAKKNLETAYVGLGVGKGEKSQRALFAGLDKAAEKLARSVCPDLPRQKGD